MVTGIMQHEKEVHLQYHPVTGLYYLDSVLLAVLNAADIKFS